VSAPIRFDWDEGNVDHISRHAYTPEEVEEVFVGRHKVRRTRDNRYLAYGKTLDGRFTLVVFVKPARGAIRVITSREMSEKERRLYNRK